MQKISNCKPYSTCITRAFIQTDRQTDRSQTQYCSISTPLLWSSYKITYKLLLFTLLLVVYKLPKTLKLVVTAGVLNECDCWAVRQCALSLAWTRHDTAQRPLTRTVTKPMPAKYVVL